MPGFWGDEYVVDALKKLIPFLFRSFCNLLIFKLKKIGGTKTGSQLATLSVIFSSAHPDSAQSRSETRDHKGSAQCGRGHLTMDDYMKTANRVYTLERSFNMANSFARADDTIPPRMYKEALSKGAAKGKILKLGTQGRRSCRGESDRHDS